MTTITATMTTTTTAAMMTCRRLPARGRSAAGWPGGCAATVSGTVAAAPGATVTAPDPADPADGVATVGAAVDAAVGAAVGAPAGAAVGAPAGAAAAPAGAAGWPPALMMAPASMMGTGSASSQPGPHEWAPPSARATPKDSAVAYRSAGSVASPCITTAATGLGTPGAASRRGTGFSKACWNSCDISSPPP